MAGGMAKPFHLRLATPADAEAMLAIYAPLVAQTAISFELVPPSAGEMAQRIGSILPEYPWLVAERDGFVLGYAYASRYRPRPAYQWCVECSVYVHPEARRQGVAAGLYKTLFEILKLQGLYKVYAAITLPNAGSVAVHEALGFLHFATYRSVGYKLGSWHDVGWWELDLRSALGEPAALLPFGQLAGSERVAALLAGLS